jgi:hypothetical protein
VASGQIRNQNFLFELLEVSLLNNISFFLYIIYIFREKKYNRPPGSGAAGFQVDSGQVKNQNFLFEQLEVRL